MLRVLVTKQNVSEIVDLVQFPRCVGKPIIYQRNRVQEPPCDRRSQSWPRGHHGEVSCRDWFYQQRHNIRALRRHAPTHYDVLWWQLSLGLDTYTANPVERQAEGWGFWLRIAGPVGKLPA
jgi:hypothetical protein